MWANIKNRPSPAPYPPSSRTLLSPHFGAERHLVSLLRPYSPLGRELSYQGETDIHQNLVSTMMRRCSET